MNDLPLPSPPEPPLPSPVSPLEARVNALEKATEKIIRLLEAAAERQPAPAQVQQSNPLDVGGMLRLGREVLGLFDSFDTLVQRRALALSAASGGPSDDATALDSVDRILDKFTGAANTSKASGADGFERFNPPQQQQQPQQKGDVEEVPDV